MDLNATPRVVVIGAGFGGLWAVRTLAKKPCDVMVIDRNNYHTFLALLYQVAAAELEAEEIAYPIRSIFRNLPSVDFALAHAGRVDVEKRVVETDNRFFPYDYLILATGSVSHSFGIRGVGDHAFFLKTLEEGVALKNHIVCCFERAAGRINRSKDNGALTFVIVGGGATGVEYAGALSELIHGPMVNDYRNIDFRSVRIILLEGTDRLVGSMPSSIRSYTIERLGQMGVEVRLKTRVMEVTPESVVLEGGEAILTQTVVWTAGVRGEPLASLSGIPTGSDGRVSVLPTLQIPAHPEIYVVGDLARIDAKGQALPMVAQVAIQSAVAAADNIGRQIDGQEPLPFRYRDRGSMITIGRNTAGVAMGSRTYTGFFAWLLWLIIHLFNLIGFRNRIMVLINWAWDYLLYERAVRFVFPSEIPSIAKSSACTDKTARIVD
ncbi:MAG: NAD(P)/FAD-dependent oxidoreductase [Deltaproteobacteria bacterium]|nr:NAD(P)/FAD-dependent oxidoreductase [Deltaproteobacteria bacterium]